MSTMPYMAPYSLMKHKQWGAHIYRCMRFLLKAFLLPWTYCEERGGRPWSCEAALTWVSCNWRDTKIWSTQEIGFNTGREMILMGCQVLFLGFEFAVDVYGLAKQFITFCIELRKGRWEEGADILKMFYYVRNIIEHLYNVTLFLLSWLPRSFLSEITPVLYSNRILIYEMPQKGNIND